MSAAEKLAALVEGFFEDTEPSGYEAPVEVVRALPQIVAVVEAAEDFTGYDWHATQWLTAPLEDKRAINAEDVEQLKESRRKAQAALVALDEQLGAVT